MIEDKKVMIFPLLFFLCLARFKLLFRQQFQLVLNEIVVGFKFGNVVYEEMRSNMFLFEGIRLRIFDLICKLLLCILYIVRVSLDQPANYQWYVLKFEVCLSQCLRIKCIFVKQATKKMEFGLLLPTLLTFQSSENSY